MLRSFLSGLVVVVMVGCTGESVLSVQEPVEVHDDLLESLNLEDLLNLEDSIDVIFNSEEI